MEDHQPDGRFLAGLFVGGIVGALTIFFLGTREGKKAAKAIRAKGEDIVEDLEEKVEDLKERGNDLLERGEELKQQVLDQIEDKKHELSHQATKQLDNALAQVEETQKEGLSTTSSLRKHLFKNAPKK